MRTLLIGIDSGTQSTKALVVDAKSGKVLGSVSAAYDLIPNLPPCAKEQHPETWRDATANAIQGALKQAKAKASEVVAIGVSGQQHGFVPLDKSGAVIRPAKRWHTCALDGSDAKQFGDGLENHAFPAASPDGNRVVLLRYAKGQPSHPYLFDVAGKEIGPVTQTKGFFFAPAWRWLDTPQLARSSSFRHCPTAKSPTSNSPKRRRCRRSTVQPWLANIRFTW